MIVVGQEAIFTPPDYEPEIYGYIYKITNKINGKMYIGQTTQTVEKRWSKHRYTSTYVKTHNLQRSPLYPAMNKYGNDAFEITTLATAYNNSHLNDLECYYIDQNNTLIPNGYNIRSGGSQCPMAEETKQKISVKSASRKHTQESKDRMSRAQTGKQMLEATKQKISEANQGRTLSAYQREVLRQANIGKVMSQETKDKIKASKTGTILQLTDQELERRREFAKNRHYAFTPEVLENNGKRWFEAYDMEGNLIGTFINKKHCSTMLGMSRSYVSDCLKGIIKSKRYIFKYIEKE